MSVKELLTAEVSIKDNWVYFQCPHCLQEWYGNIIREYLRTGDVIICRDGLTGCDGKIKLVPAPGCEKMFSTPARIFLDDDMPAVRCPGCDKIWRGGGIVGAQLSGRSVHCGNGLVGLGCGEVFRVI